jgi:hypothetical protein
MEKKVMLIKKIGKVKVKAKRKTGKDRHYIDDAKFHKALSDYQVSVQAAADEGLPKPTVPDYIAKSLMTLARKVARKPGFSRYPFIEDMIGDAILCCFKNIHNFNPKHPTAFPYFTQIVHYSFIQKILKEHTALYRKFRAVIEKQKEMCGDANAESLQIYGTRYSDLQMREFCEKFERRLEEKRAKSRQRKKAAATKIPFDEDASEIGDFDGPDLD